MFLPSMSKNPEQCSYFNLGLNIEQQLQVHAPMVIFNWFAKKQRSLENVHSISNQYVFMNGNRKRLKIWPYMEILPEEKVLNDQPVTKQKPLRTSDNQKTPLKVVMK